jgi:uncharacterized protein (DUF2141 family)
MNTSTSRSLALACFASCCAVAALACPTAHAASLDLTVTDLRTQQGSLRIAIADSEAGWSDTEKAVAGTVRKAQGTEQKFHFPDLPPGSYAVMVMHDENDNGELDSNFMGMPIEGYGFSNNPGVMRKPTFEEARFELGADGGAITVRLR